MSASPGPPRPAIPTVGLGPVPAARVARGATAPVLGREPLHRPADRSGPGGRRRAGCGGQLSDRHPGHRSGVSCRPPRIAAAAAVPPDTSPGRPRAASPGAGRAEASSARRHSSAGPGRTVRASAARTPPRRVWRRPVPDAPSRWNAQHRAGDSAPQTGRLVTAATARRWPPRRRVSRLRVREREQHPITAPAPEGHAPRVVIWTCRTGQRGHRHPSSLNVRLRGPGGRVAGHVRDGARPARDDPLHDQAPGAGAGRVEHHHVRAGQAGQGTLHIGAYDHDAVQVPARRAGRDRVGLDERDPSGRTEARGQRTRERSDAAVEVPRPPPSAGSSASSTAPASVYTPPDALQNASAALSTRTGRATAVAARQDPGGAAPAYRPTASDAVRRRHLTCPHRNTAGPDEAARTAGGR